MDNEISDIIIQAVSETLHKGLTPHNIPDILANHKGLNALLSEITVLQQFTRGIAGGDLDQTISLKGLMAGALKSLQASLRHLTWQTQRIASGDFSHNVDFMGEFSEAFNGMVKALIDAQSQIEQRELALCLANEELERAKSASEAANRAKNEFLANIGHEVRTPLNAIIGFTYLAMSTELKSKQHEYMNKTLQSAHSLLGIFNDILDFAKLEAGHSKMEYSDFLLSDVMQRMSNNIKIKVNEKRLKFRCVIANEVPHVLTGDHTKLNQILINLANNAVKFTEKGEVNVTAELDSYPLSDRVKLRFSIKDSGIGIPTDKIPILFNSFTQADGSLTRKFGGTGLGLVICKRLTEMMNGEISVQSESGKGSTFSFTAEFGLKPFSSDLPAHVRIFETTPKLEDPESTKIICADTDMVCPSDISKIEPMLTELKSLLDAGDFDAIAYMNKIRKELTGIVAEDRVLLLKNYIQDYEFEKADNVLKEIRKYLCPTPPER